VTMLARDAIDFRAVASVIGNQLHAKAPLEARTTLHAPLLDATFGHIAVLTDLDLLIVLESALHEALAQACEDLRLSTGRPCSYEIDRREDRIEAVLITDGRRVELAPVGLRDVTPFP
jgi:hypothetical protein